MFKHFSDIVRPEQTELVILCRATLQVRHMCQLVIQTFPRFGTFRRWQSPTCAQTARRNCITLFRRFTDHHMHLMFIQISSRCTQHATRDETICKEKNIFAIQARIFVAHLLSWVSSACSRFQTTQGGQEPGFWCPIGHKSKNKHQAPEMFKWISPNLLDPFVGPSRNSWPSM